MLLVSTNSFIDMKGLLSKLSPKLIGLITGSIAILSVGSYFLLNSPESTNEEAYIEYKVSEEYSEYISAYTSGDISVNSSIRVRFTESQVEDDKVGTIDDRDLLDITPSIDGKAKWVDSFTLEFIPDNWLKNDQVYEIELDLSELMEVKKDLSSFKFNFHTIKQDFEVITNDLITSADNMKKVALTGVLNTADVTKHDDIEKALSAKQEGNDLKITWIHSSPTSHEFKIESINRTKKESKVTLNWDGASIGVDKKGSSDQTIPALGDFQVLKTEPQLGSDQFILISFSDPIDPNQDLTGLITTDKKNVSFKFTIENNFIRAYPSKKIIGTFELTIHEGVKNVLGYKMKKAHNATIVFEQVKPAVRLVGNGIVVPKSNGLVFPFEAVGLRAVDVTIIEIFENNVVQFFQDNNMDGNHQLKRVARPIFKQSLVLDKNKLLNLNKWQRFTIDLADLITPTPGAIYQVQIGFRRSQSVYSCGGEKVQDELKPIKQENWTAESYTNYSYWDYYEDGYNGDYDWSERENPCHHMYYRNGNKAIKRNIIASNIALIAKRGTDNKLFVAITDLVTTEPIEGTDIEVYDFQQQPIANGKTDSKGFITLDTKTKPFLIKATKGTDVNYLKVDDGSSLSLSNFNVGGTKVQKGLKGFIYGERGVWRPGDTLFMTFILEDKNNVLPKNHPVVFELRNPDGKLVNKVVKTKNVNGFYTYQPITSDEAMTGGWRVKAKVGNTTFSERVKIETIKPNRLKIDLDYGKEYLSVNDQGLDGNLEVKWLHGGIAKNLKAEFELVLTKAATTFKRYESYSFEDQSRQFTPEIFKLFEGNLDANGKAKVPADIQIEGDAPGKLNATFKGKVFEQGGDFSIDQFTLPYYPYESFVGVRMPEGDHRGMLLTDKKQPIDIISLNPEGTPKGNHYVKVEVFKLDWRWWWDQSSNSSSNYIGVNYRTPVAEKMVKLTNGKAVYDLEINYPSWGRYYVKITDNKSSHSAGKIFYMDWPGWAGKAKRDLPDAASMLTFSSDKEEYKVGETMTLTIPGSGEGNALISIESGSKVVESYWMKLNKGENQFNVNITDKMAPNVYVHVTALQPHAQTINDHPIRMYGVIPIEVVDENTHLYPVLKMPKTLSPGKNVPITVSEKNGKPMTFTVAVVDEGLLSLTNFKTPNPWPHFYQHEALGINTWDMYKFVLGAYGGALEKALAIGGDGSIVNKDGEKTKRFKPVVRYFGPYHIDVSEKKNIEFKMPNYIGAVRTMVVAGYEGAYGKTDQETPVRQSLMVLGTLPRVLSPGEKLKLPVNVFAYSNDIGTTTVKVKATGPLKTIESTKTITFSKKGDKMVYFDLEVAKKIGASKVTITATSGNRVSNHEIDIEIRNPNPFITETKEKVLQPGESITYDYKTLGMKGTNSYSLETATVPPLNLSKRLKYLTRYPHGCVEQTTSAAFPQLFLTKLTELTLEQKERIETNIKKGIERLSSMQLTSGGFGYWPSRSYASDWGSSYAGHFLVLAKKKGYYVPSNIISDWKKYQKKKAKNWMKSTSYNSDLQQAYRLYTLALAGSPDKGAMNRLKEKSLNKTAQYMLAASYALTGRSDVAKDLIASAPPTIKNYREYWYTYGSNKRDEAMLLVALNSMKDAENGMIAVKKISKRLNNKRWLSTQETAWSLLAISDFLNGQPVSSTVNMEMVINGKTTLVTSQYSVFNKEMNENELTNKTVTINNTSNGILYVNLSSTGQPLVDTKVSSNEVINMSVEYSDKDGNAVSPLELEQSTDFLVSVTVSNSGLRGDLKEMALSTYFPSGWEIQNTRMDAIAAHYQSDKPDYQDYRDDRVFTYFDIKSGASKTFTFLVNASYAGEFTLPAIQCEAMYDNAVQAYFKGGKTKTVK